MSNFNTAMPCTDPMVACGIDWLGVKAFAEDSINLIQNHGDVFKDMIATGFKAFTAVTGRDYATILSCLQQEKLDVDAAIAAIKLEFHLS